MRSNQFKETVDACDISSDGQMKSIRDLVENGMLIEVRPSAPYNSMQIFYDRVTVTGMQHEITTSEAVEIFSVTRKTIAEWAKSGIMEKTSYGKYNLKNSLRNYIVYQKVLREGYHDPLLVWTLRMDEIWKAEEEERRPRRKVAANAKLGTLADLAPIELVLEELPPLVLEPFEIERDASGRIVRARRTGT